MGQFPLSGAKFADSNISVLVGNLPDCFSPVPLLSLETLGSLIMGERLKEEKNAGMFFIFYFF